MTATSAQGAAADSHLWIKSYPRGVDWRMALRPAPLYRLVDEAAARFPDKPCTNFLGKTLTYREISAHVDKAAAGLQAIGVQRGTKVGLFLPNSPTFIIYYYAVLKAGGVVVNYNPLYTHEELAFQVRDSETELMVTLDLKLLFDKVEALVKSGSLSRAIVVPFAGLLPAAKSVLFKLFKAKELAKPQASPIASKIVFEANLLAN